MNNTDAVDTSVMIWTMIREVLGSNLGRHYTYSGDGFFVISLSPFAPVWGQYLYWVKMAGHAVA
jgi:hypothetical protein